MSKDKQPKGKAIKIKLDKAEPTAREVIEMQKLARRTSLTLLNLLEAKENNNE